MAPKQASEDNNVAITAVARFGASLDYLPPGPDKIHIGLIDLKSDTNAHYNPKQPFQYPSSGSDHLI